MNAHHQHHQHHYEYKLRRTEYTIFFGYYCCCWFFGDGLGVGAIAEAKYYIVKAKWKRTYINRHLSSHNNEQKHTIRPMKKIAESYHSSCNKYILLSISFRSVIISVSQPHLLLIIKSMCLFLFLLVIRNSSSFASLYVFVLLYISLSAFLFCAYYLYTSMVML